MSQRWKVLASGPFFSQPIFYLKHAEVSVSLVSLDFAENGFSTDIANHTFDNVSTWQTSACANWPKAPKQPDSLPLQPLNITWSQNICTCQETVGNPGFTPDTDLWQCLTCPRWRCWTVVSVFCCKWVEMSYTSCCNLHAKEACSSMKPGMFWKKCGNVLWADELHRPVWWAEVISF